MVGVWSNLQVPRATSGTAGAAGWLSSRLPHRHCHCGHSAHPCVPPSYTTHLSPLYARPGEMCFYVFVYVRVHVQGNVHVHTIHACSKSTDLC